MGAKFWTSQDDPDMAVIKWVEAIELSASRHAGKRAGSLWQSEPELP